MGAADVSDPTVDPSQTVADKILRIIETRVEPITAVPFDFHLDEEINPPAGYEQAFLAGGRPPFPLGGALRSDLAGPWMELRLSPEASRLVPRPDAVSRQLSQVSGFSNSGFSGGLASKWQDSRNWSGAILTSLAGERLSAACGTWTVPGARVSASASPPIAGPTSADPLSRRVSVWVGLDGHRRIAGSMPQIGTTTVETVANDGTTSVQAYAWGQWWVRGEQFGEVVFQDFSVSPGDEVTCWLALLNPQRVTLCIRNETTGKSGGSIWRSSPGGDPLEKIILPREAPVAGQAAVWVVERPTVMGRTDLYPLPDFGSIEFKNCMAAAGASGSTFYQIPTLRGLGGCRLVRMYDRLNNIGGTRYVSNPDPASLHGSGFEVRYRN